MFKQVCKLDVKAKSPESGDLYDVITECGVVGTCIPETKGRSCRCSYTTRGDNIQIARQR